MLGAARPDENDSHLARPEPVRSGTVYSYRSEPVRKAGMRLIRICESFAIRKGFPAPIQVVVLR